MEDKMACTGTLSDIQYLKRSGRIRVSIDIEPEMANAYFERLGGYPKPGESRWVGLAVLDIPRELDNVPDTQQG